MNIHPQLVTLNQLLNGRLFRIPEYQRSYSWEPKQRRDLFSDIDKTYPTDRTHFLATVVGLRRGTRNILTNEFHEIEVVDGQQRLTTLVLLLKAIEIALDPTDPVQAAVGSELGALLVKADQLAPVLLQTNHDSSQFCSTYLREGTHVNPSEAKTLADRALLHAMSECEAFVARWKAADLDLVDLVALLKNRLVFIFHELSDESTVYTVLRF